MGGGQCGIRQVGGGHHERRELFAQPIDADPGCLGRLAASGTRIAGGARDRGLAEHERDVRLAPPLHLAEETLNDLTHLKNLKIIRIEMQDITDISPLSQLEALEEVDLNHNPIADVSPLAGLFSLRAVWVVDSRVSEFSSLASCPLLGNIDAGKTRVTSFDAFAGLSGLTFLKVTFAPLSSLAGIDSLAGLERLELGDVQYHDLTPLLKMPLLKEVCLLEGQRTDAERDLSGATFQVHFS